MTETQANILAERLQKQPQLYKQPPSFGNFFFRNTLPNYPWCQNGETFPLSLPWSQNLYFSPLGFSQEYEGLITDWAATNLYNKSKRYVTIDDIRMIAYLGIEYAKAKLLGWCFFYEDILNEWFHRYTNIFSDQMKKGYIARSQTGMRYIKRTNNDPLYLNFKRTEWTPLRQNVSFEIPSEELFSLPEDFTPDKELFSGSVKVGTIEGRNEIVNFMGCTIEHGRGESGEEYNPSRYRSSSIVTKGNFSVELQPEGLPSNNQSLKLIVYQQSVTPRYYIRNRLNPNYYWYDEKPSTEAGYVSSEEYEIDETSSMVPLKKGTRYNIIITFDNTRLVPPSKLLYQYDTMPMLYLPIISCTRTPLETRAPYFAESKNPAYHIVG